MLRPKNPVRPITIVLALALAIAGLSSAPAVAHHSDDHHAGPPECVEGYRDYPGTGRACKNDHGTYNVPVGNGKVLETHGPDSASETPRAPGGVKGKPKPAAEDGSTSAYYGGICTAAGRRNELVYAVAHDDTDDYANMAPAIRSKFVEIDNYLNSEAGQFGAQTHYNILCDADGQPTVHHAVLPTTSKNNYSFWSIVNDLGALGYADVDVNYWVYFDETSYLYAGQGNFCRVYDEDNNYCLERDFAAYGISYGYLDVRTLMHENGHNMGAVQYSAPNSSGAAHCNDGYDIMCYADGGSKSDYKIVCGGRYHYDCNHDDYFHPDPPAGSYLAENWNIGSCVNLFLLSDRCNKPPQVVAPSDAICLALLECSTGYAKATDVDADMKSWRWSFISCAAGSCPTLRSTDGTVLSSDSDKTWINPAYFTPAQSGQYELQVAVTDAKGNVGTDQMMITVP